MAVMTDTGPQGVAYGRSFTVHDLEDMPDDGNRYELLDGTLLVSPAPGLRHQKIAYRLHSVLEAVAPHGFEVVGAPFAVRTSARTELQPDVLVARDEDLTETHLPVAPVLAVEVLSRSTGLFDRTAKRAAYARLGVPTYWVIDPQDPSLLAFELDETGEYQRLGQVKGHEAWEARTPFPVTVVPADLLGKRYAD